MYKENNENSNGRLLPGIVRINSYPLAAATIAKPIPVLPEVGSTRTVLPGVITPLCTYMLKEC
jgi:hypothetical protein